MRVDSLFRSAQWDPAVVFASIAANTLSLIVPISMIHLYDRIIPNTGYETLASLALVVASAIIIEAILRSARRFIIERAGDQFEIRSYNCAFDVVVNGQPTIVDGFSYGRLTMSVNSIDRLRKIHTGDTAMALLDLPFALLFLLAVGLISPISSLAVGGILLSTLLVLSMARNRSLKLEKFKRDLDARKTSFLGEVFSSIGAIKNLRIEQAMCRRYERLVGRSASAQAESARISQFAQGFTATAASFSPVTVACIGAFQVIEDEMTVGALAAVILLTGRIIQPALRVEAYLAGLSSTAIERRELEDILSTPKLATSHRPLPSIDSLAFEQLSTRKSSQTSFWFEGINLSLKRGDCVVVTGPSNRACSAFLQLFLGESLTTGCYEINGQDVSQFDSDQRYRQIRYLTRDEPFLSGSLIENLTNFREEELQHDALDLARRMGLDEALFATTEGFNLRVGEKSSSALPSSLADVATVIAGLVDAPDVVLFDQTNAAFDFETDQRFLDLIARHRSDRITLISSERPSFQKLANRRFDITPFLRMSDTTCECT